MPHSHDSSPNDCLDQAIEEILSNKSSAAYSVITAIERMIRQFNLNTEAHVLLFEAYLRGKDALDDSKEIQVPKAWLKGTAYNLAREKFRKQRKLHDYAPELMDVLFAEHSNSPLDEAILREEIAAVLQAMTRLKTEKPDVFELIHLRVVEGLAWREIKGWYEQAHPGKAITEDNLRQRYCRGRRYLRSIFHEVMPVE